MGEFLTCGLSNSVSNIMPHSRNAALRTGQPHHGGGYYLKLTGCLLALGLLYALSS